MLYQIIVLKFHKDLKQKDPTKSSGRNILPVSKIDFVILKKVAVKQQNV